MNKFTFHLAEDEICIIITVEGELYDCYYDDYDKVLENFEMIANNMLSLLETPEARDGITVWRIKDDGSEVLSERIFDNE